MARDNNGMHPSADTTALILRQWRGARVMPCVRLLRKKSMATYEDKWFEVWYADRIYVTPSHLLIVTPNPENHSRVLVLDPYNKDKIVFEGKDYEEAHEWLREDEYSLIGGREFPDDGW